MIILCFGYRDWALNIYKNLHNHYPDSNVIIVNSKEKYSDSLVEEYNPDFVLFYGWSWHISDHIINRYHCIMLHPSKLPKYRGGSPIQNQIINGEKNSAVTLFKMTNDVDAGPILFQEDLTLNGHLSDIFSRIEDIGYRGTLHIIDNPDKGIKQIEDEATYYKRRTESQSEITLEELSKQSAEYLYDKIRMLESPYPNAYFKTKDGKRLLFKSVELID